MAYGRHDGDGTCRYRPDHHLVREGQQVLKGAPSPADNDHFGLATFDESVEGRYDGIGGLFTLHESWGK